MFLSSLKKVFASKIRTIIYIFLVLGASAAWWYTTDIAVTLGNLGAEGKTIYVYLDIVVSWLVTLLFPLFIIAFSYRGYVLGDKRHLNKKSWLGALGGLIGTILSGCSCCGVTMASYLGLLPLMSFVPYEWLLGIKFLGLLALLYALYDLLNNLESCKVQKKTTRK